MSQIHTTTVISPDANVADDVEIGPYCVIGAQVSLGSAVRLHSHVVIEGMTSIGEKTEIYPFASIGHIPQDKKYGGEDSRLEIGSGNIIREYVTMNPGTSGGGLVTRIGSNGLYMAGSHVAHDCVVGDHVVFANNATLAGHCSVGDYSILGGLSAVHQFVRIGEHAFVGGMSGVENDVIPFGMALGNRASLSGLNIIGLKRQNFDREQIHSLRKAYRLLFSSEGNLKERMEDVEKMFPDDPYVEMIIKFIRTDSERSLCVPRNAE